MAIIVNNPAILENAHLLWEKLIHYKNDDVVVVAASKGSAATSHYLAEKLQAPWEVISCKEIKHPANPTKTIGSVSSNEVLIHDESSIPCNFIDHQIQLLQHSIAADKDFFSTIAESHELKYKTVIVVCDYLKNYDSVAATLRTIKNQYPLKIIVACISVEPETARKIASSADEVVFLKMETSFRVGIGYSKRYPPLERRLQIR